MARSDVSGPQWGFEEATGVIGEGFGGGGEWCWGGGRDAGGVCVEWG